MSSPLTVFDVVRLVPVADGACVVDNVAAAYDIGAGVRGDPHVVNVAAAPDESDGTQPPGGAWVVLVNDAISTHVCTS